MSALMEHQDRTALRRAVRRLRGDTPHRLVLLTVGLAVLGVLLGVVSALGLMHDSASFTNLEARAESVDATSDLYYRLNDMAAMAANVLLVGYHPADPSIVPPTVDAAASAGVYQSDRTAADDDLGQIAQNPRLLAQADKLVDALGSYEALTAQAFYIDQNTRDEQPAQPPPAALNLYEQASDLLHNTLLPDAQQITDADSTEVNDAYSDDHSAMIGFAFAILLLGVLTAVALLLGNRYHDRMFRRRVGLLALGAVVALGLGLAGLGTGLAAACHLQVAKQDAYNSIYALDQARAVSDDANADESRWLLENPTSNSPLQASFFQKMTEVGGTPQVSAAQAVADPQAYYSAMGVAVGGLKLDAAGNSVQGVTITGYLGTELRNITFPGEARAAYNTATAFNAYVQDDAAIRADARAGNLAGAVALDIGLQPDQSNYRFNAYTTDLGTVIQINEDYFNSAVAAGRGDVGAATWAVLIVGVLALLLTVWQAGYLRLREYR
jgi:hypothetical protein